MSESDVHATAFRDRKIAIWAALVLAMLALILGGYAAVCLDRIGRQCDEFVRSHGEFESLSLECGFCSTFWPEGGRNST
ncbi:MAG: hypothetical protein HQ592_18955 [Planctomycetes bacterium]|nr:hypothetical protein [Planctomycetota bacterium]